MYLINLIRFSYKFQLRHHQFMTGIFTSDNVQVEWKYNLGIAVIKRKQRTFIKLTTVHIEHINQLA